MKKTLLTALAILLLIVVGIFYRRQQGPEFSLTYCPLKIITETVGDSRSTSPLYNPTYSNGIKTSIQFQDCSIQEVANAFEVRDTRSASLEDSKKNNNLYGLSYFIKDEKRNLFDEYFIAHESSDIHASPTPILMQLGRQFGNEMESIYDQLQYALTQNRIAETFQLRSIYLEREKTDREEAETIATPMEIIAATTSTTCPLKILSEEFDGEALGYSKDENGRKVSVEFRNCDTKDVLYASEIWDTRGYSLQESKEENKLYGILYFVEGKNNLVNAYFVESEVGTGKGSLVFTISKQGFGYAMVEKLDLEYNGDNIIMNKLESDDNQPPFFLIDVKNKAFLMVVHIDRSCCGTPGIITRVIESSFTRNPILIKEYFEGFHDFNNNQRTLKSSIGNEVIDISDSNNPEDINTIKKAEANKFLQCEIALGTTADTDIFDRSVSEVAVLQHVRNLFQEKRLYCLKQNEGGEYIGTKGYINLVNNAYVEQK